MNTVGAYIGVQDVIKTICLRENDMSMSMGAVYASYLPSVYNDLRFSVTKRTVTKKYYLDLVNNSLVMPNDCLLIVAVGYEDSCGRIKPLWYNNKIPLPLLFENSLPCNCATCGEENTSCGMVKSFDKVKEEVTIEGETYTNYVITTMLQDGTVIKTTRTWAVAENEEAAPSGDDVEIVEIGGDRVVYPIDVQEEQCVLDLLPCGCVATTTSNTLKIQTLCDDCCSFNTGCGQYNTSCCDVAVNSWKLDIQGRLIVLSPNYDKDYVILKYVTAINNANDYQIPSIALEAMIRGIKYYYALDDKKAAAYTRGRRGINHDVYQAELNKLRKRLNPLNWDMIMDSLGIMSKKKQCIY